MTFPVLAADVAQPGSDSDTVLRPSIAAAPASQIGELAMQTPQTPPFSRSVRLSKGDGSILHFPTLAAAIPSLDLDLRLI